MQLLNVVFWSSLFVKMYHKHCKSSVSIPTLQNDLECTRSSFSDPDVQNFPMQRLLRKPLPHPPHLSPTAHRLTDIPQVILYNIPRACNHVMWKLNLCLRCTKWLVKLPPCDKYIRLTNQSVTCEVLPTDLPCRPVRQVNILCQV